MKRGIKMENLSKYIKHYDVMARDVNFLENMKISTIFAYFEDVAGNHASALDIGFETISKDLNLAWVLTRIKVDILKLPVWKEGITVETWPHKPQKVKFLRDYYIKDEEGNILIKASSIWALIDIDTRELQKTDRLSFELPEWVEDKAVTDSHERFKPVHELKEAYKKVIGCTDIDMNGHLNNSRYIDYIMDCFNMNDLKSHKVSSIEVNYINEALPGDTIILRKEASMEGGLLGENVNSDCRESSIYIDGIRENDGTSIFRSVLKII